MTGTTSTTDRELESILAAASAARAGFGAIDPADRAELMRACGDALLREIDAGVAPMLNNRIAAGYAQSVSDVSAAPGVRMLARAAGSESTPPVVLFGGAGDRRGASPQFHPRPSLEGTPWLLGATMSRP